MDLGSIFAKSLLGSNNLTKLGVFLGSAAGVGGDHGGAAVHSETNPKCPQRSLKGYDMKSSINMWAFPYPDKMSLEQCLELAKRAGFDGIEPNFNLEGDISPDTSEKDLTKIRSAAERIGITISGLCTFVYWPYPFTSNQQSIREKAIELAVKMIHVAHHLGTDNLLVVAGSVGIPWIKDAEEVPYEVCDQRARSAIEKLIPIAEKMGVNLNIENIFFNGYLMSPRDMIEFVDSFQSPNVHVHFDTGNISPLQYPEHWIPLLGHRIKNVHLKEYSKNGTDFTLESFRPLLDGTTNWPAVMEAFDQVKYHGFLTFEYFHPFAHYPEALIYQASDALARILGRPNAIYGQ